MTLPENIKVEFDCGNYSKEQIIVAQDELPTDKEGLVFHRANLPKGTVFSVELNFGRESIDSMSDELPVDWSNPVEWGFEGYSQADKELLNQTPVVGDVLEAVAPDAKWNFDLWYDFQVSASGKFDYKLHFGPTSNVGVREKLEGTVQLVQRGT
jgi:hypothetical protein